MRVATRRIVRLAAIAGAVSIGALHVSAETTAKKAPRRAVPARTAAAAPDKTGSIAEPAKQAVTPTTSADTRAELVPFYLPDVPRPRMRACGEEWREKKMNGSAGDEAWREFAIKCLAADNSAGSR